MKTNNSPKTGINFRVTIDDDQVSKIINALPEKDRKQLLEEIYSDEKETLHTPKKTSEIFDVNLSTLWRWKKKKYLVPIEIGGKRRYRLSDIERILNGGR